MELPPYRRIAEGIAARIAAGELAPGDRVPSTRRLTAEHGIAMATATKVIAALREQGLVHAVPGVGTVVTGPAQPAAPAGGDRSRPTPDHTASHQTAPPPPASHQTAPPPPASDHTASHHTAADQSGRRQGAPEQGASHSGRRKQAGQGRVGWEGEGATDQGRGRRAARDGEGSTNQGRGRRAARDGQGATDQARGRDGESATDQGRRRRVGRGGDGATDRERVVRVAVGIADAEGLAGLSMRRLAGELGMPTMSLYRHVTGREELLLLMMESVFAGNAPPALSPATAGWRACVEALARLQWAMYRRHPWLSQAINFTRPLLAPRAMAHTEWTMRALDGHGLAPDVLFLAAVSVANHVRGTAVNLEDEAQAEQETGLTDHEWLDTQQGRLVGILTSGHYPLLARAVTDETLEFDVDRLLEFGLQRLLDGLAPLLEG